MSEAKQREAICAIGESIFARGLTAGSRKYQRADRCGSADCGSFLISARA